MNPLDNRYERNPALFRDMPENLFEDRGLLPAVFYREDGTELECHLHYEADGIEFTVDCSLLKDEKLGDLRRDLLDSIELRFNRGFLSRKDLKLQLVI